MIDVEHHHACPFCGAIHDRVTCVTDDQRPNADDISLCIQCGEWSIFTADLTLREPTEDELLEISHDRECIAARHAWNETIKAWG